MENCNSGKSKFTQIFESLRVGIFLSLLAGVTGCSNPSQKTDSALEWEIVNCQGANINSLVGVNSPPGENSLVIMYNKRTGKSYYFSKSFGVSWMPIGDLQLSNPTSP
jgi:hypothetical protein